ncbi:cell division regulator GpsB [Kurthia senegalensis]|uniref:cell division regulator GpsB n=1 Tax=Kurthia senegalensis TaxID=1033740 RepID=UPI000289A24F|nr:cell division regulator GpsB [Kurthia senegalensis]
MDLDIKLSAKVILDKDFKTGLRGYSQDEVDQFLDEIIQDYESFEQVLKQKDQKIAQLEAQLAEAPQTPTRLKKEEPVVEKAVVHPTAQTGTTNYDILKRIANLEKRVFGDKLYDDFAD